MGRRTKKEGKAKAEEEGRRHGGNCADDRSFWSHSPMNCVCAEGKSELVSGVRNWKILETVE